MGYSAAHLNNVWSAQPTSFLRPNGLLVGRHISSGGTGRGTGSAYHCPQPKRSMVRWHQGTWCAGPPRGGLKGAEFGAGCPQQPEFNPAHLPCSIPCMKQELFNFCSDECNIALPEPFLLQCHSATFPISANISIPCRQKSSGRQIKEKLLEGKRNFWILRMLW